MQHWKDDSLKFFIDMKEESNEVKGNYLRQKALRLIAAIELRLRDLFNEFTAGILEEMIIYNATDLKDQI